MALSKQGDVYVNIHSKTSGSVGSLMKYSAAVAAATAAIAKFFTGVNKLIAENTEAMHSSARLAAALKATGNAVGISADEMARMSGEMESLLAIDGDLITNAQGLMVTFTQIGKEVFPDAIKAAADMSAMFGQDLQQSVISLGTALNDPIQGIGRLRRIGVSFTESQKQSIAAFMAQNDVMSAQKVILNELTREFGGVAEAMAGVDSQNKQFRIVMANLREEGGRLLRDWLDPKLAILTIWGNKILGLSKNIRLWRDDVEDLGVAFSELEFGDTATVKHITEMVAAYRAEIAKGGAALAENRRYLAAWLEEAVLFNALPAEVAVYNEAMRKAIELQEEFLTPETTLQDQIVELGLLRNQLRELGFDTTYVQDVINALDDLEEPIDKGSSKLKEMAQTHKNATIAAFDYGDQIKRNIEIINEMTDALAPNLVLLAAGADVAYGALEKAGGPLKAMWTLAKDDIWQNMTGFIEAWGASFVDIESGAELAKDALKGMAIAGLRAIGEYLTAQAALYGAMVLAGDLTKIPALGAAGGGAIAAYAAAGAVATLGDGGIVTRPTLALIGERGPEAVVPLSGGGGYGGTVININAGSVIHQMQLENMIASIARRVAR